MHIYYIHSIVMILLNDLNCIDFCRTLFHTDVIVQEVLGVRAWTVANHATALMQLRSTTQMEITGRMDLLFHVHSCHCAPMLLTQELWEARFMCVDTTKEQVIKTIHLHCMNSV